MVIKLNLVVKSEKQYNKVIAKLEELGAQRFFITGYDESTVGINDYGVGCFIEPDRFHFTDGISSPCSVWENFYTVKSFIAAVKAAKAALGESE